MTASINRQAILKKRPQGLPDESCRWELVNAAANANVVLTERVDNFVINGKTVSVPVMGTF